MLFSTKLKLIARASGVVLTTCLVSGVPGAPGYCSAQTQTSSSTPLSATAQQDQPDPQKELLTARNQVRESPDDPKAHFALAELLKKAGRHQEAAQEYCQATELDPGFYLAYHQLSTLSVEMSQLDDVIARLIKVKEEKPKDLVLRVALSELLEKRGKYYQGARVLVDLVYQNGVPDKHLAKVNARIHYLLAKSRDSKATDKAASLADDELDTLPPPLPEATLKKDLAASRLKESRVMRGVGHAPLLP